MAQTTSPWAAAKVLHGQDGQAASLAARVRRARAFTLIELLIVIAIMVIMTAAALDLQVHLVREQSKQQVAARLASGCQSVVEIIGRDLGRADAVAVPAPAGGAALLRLRLSADPGDDSGATRVEYRLRGRELVATRSFEREGEPALSQVVAQDVEKLTVERQGNLLAVDVRCGAPATIEDLQAHLRTEFLVTKWRNLP